VAIPGEGHEYVGQDQHQNGSKSFHRKTL
jgi:hypothetical protein